MYGLLCERAIIKSQHLHASHRFPISTSDCEYTPVFLDSIQSEIASCLVPKGSHAQPEEPPFILIVRCSSYTKVKGSSGVG